MAKNSKQPSQEASSLKSYEHQAVTFTPKFDDKGQLVSTTRNKIRTIRPLVKITEAEAAALNSGIEGNGSWGD